MFFPAALICDRSAQLDGNRAVNSPFGVNGSNSSVSVSAVQTQQPVVSSAQSVGDVEGAPPPPQSTSASAANVTEVQLQPQAPMVKSK